MKKAVHTGHPAKTHGLHWGFSKTGAYVSIILVLLGTGIDYMVCPKNLILLTTIRIIVSFLMYGVILLLNTKKGRRNVEFLSCIWLLLPQFLTAGILATVDKGISLYGLTLCISFFISSIVLPFSWIWHVVLSIFSLLLYFVAYMLSAKNFMLSDTFIIIFLFILLNMIISTACAYYHERVRLIFYLLNFETRLKNKIANENIKLKKNNTTLAALKGQKLQQEKMTAIGTFAAGLLHEINNPVNFCLMAIDLALEEPASKASSIISECLRDAKEGMKRVQHIVSDLKIFAYRKPDSSTYKKPFVFKKTLDLSIRLLAHEMKDIKVSRDFPANTLIYGDEAAIIGVLLHLLSNAILAMRRKMRNLDYYQAAIHISALWENERLYVTVRDNGSGVSPLNLKRIFEPFFSAVKIGQRAGLGLSISYTVIEQHGGTLIAESLVDEWTKMTFDLPRMKEKEKK